MKEYSEIIQQKYNELLNSCRHLLSYNDRMLVRKAFEMSTDLEVDYEGNIIEKETIENSYKTIIEILDIAHILTSEIGLGATSIICSMLHKKIVDEQISIETITTYFGDKITQILVGLKEISNLCSTHKIIDSENFRKLLMIFAKDVRVQLIFLAEELYALRNAEELSADERIKLVKETNYIYIPFAHKLGLYNLKSEMEDRALRYSNPSVYAEISRKLSDSKAEREKYIASFIAPIVEELEKKGVKFKVKYRTKTIASILNKMRKSQVEFEEIYDIFAVRFIIDSIGDDEKPDCWKVYSIVTDKYIPNPKRLRDWITVPKSNGYESLQTTVLGPENKWVEVQIRTERMDEIAEKGFAAHWRYKGASSSDELIENWLNDLREVLESPNNNAIDLLDDLNLNIQDKEVHVFTPAGDLKTLPVGATLLDFAYSIHSNLGDKCTGGMVNHKNVTLRYVLKNGDQISVQTSTNQHPKADWLSFTVTSKARNKIRQYLKENINQQADIGKEILQRKFKNWKIDFSDENIRRLMLFHKCKFALDLYQGIAEGRFDPNEIKDLLTADKEDNKPEITRDKDINIEQLKPLSDDVLLIDKNVNNVIYNFATCCNPVYGDDILGFVTIGQGIKVHRKQCKNAIDLQKRYPYRIVNTEWTNQGKSTYQAIINIMGKDEVGIVNKITEFIGRDPQVSMRSIAFNSSAGMFEGKITVLIDTTEHLDRLIAGIKHIAGIIKVSRYTPMMN
ncbi:MAG: HD domain-containing protein [Culturomica sp.]|jgi:GTP pyrophosphokinase|nr:HD domain-containing protein [Culturomica sp.]